MPRLTMPRLSDSMQEGTIVRWLKAPGEQVKRDEELVEIETDKATVIYEADGSGVLSIAVQEGETVPVGSVIASLDEIAAATGAGNGEAGAPAALSANGSASAGAAPKASPLARRTAQGLGIDLASVAGSGPYGRITRRDVLAAAPTLRSEPVAEPRGAATAALAAAPPDSAPAGVQRRPQQAAVASQTARGTLTTQPLTRTQAVIARRMAESRATVPAFSLEVDVDVTATLEVRARLKALADPAPSFNDIVVKACAVALRRHPRANGSYCDDRFELHERVNVGIAVAVEDALVVPTIFDADVKSLGAIATEARNLIAAARERSLTPAHLSGATFTVSNLGMYGIDRFEGIVNPPQAAILCVGAVRERPTAIAGTVQVRPSATLTLACDHRILYGAPAAELLAETKRLLEEPLALAL